MSRAALAPLSAAYGAAMSARAALYRRGWLRTRHAGVPVISVGNLAAGGTGKTPIVALVAGLLDGAGLSPAVISRGYGGRRKRDPMIVSDGTGARPLATAAEAGDEPVMLARALPGVPVVVARRRAQGASLAVERFSSRCLVLDDGFQHLALARDLDLVILDDGAPFDNGRLLPAGFLREPPGALKRAGAVILTRAAAAPGGRGSQGPPLGAWLRPETPLFHAEFRARDLAGAGGEAIHPIEWLRGRRVAAFAGIARPERFERTLSALGAEISEFAAFADHHVYTDADAERLAALASRAGALVTTEKDLSRLGGTRPGEILARAGALALRGGTAVDAAEEDAFRDLILRAAGGSAA